jgi:hypothetical protein
MNDFLEDAFLYSIATLYFCVVGFALGMVVGYLI